MVVSSDELLFVLADDRSPNGRRAKSGNGKSAHDGPAISA
jgi:hypothetical protein